MSRGRPLADKSGVSTVQSIRLSPAALDHLLARWTTVSAGVHALLCIDRAITEPQRRALIHRYGTLSRAILECVRNEVGPGMED